MTAGCHLDHAAGSLLCLAHSPAQETGIQLAGNIDILRMQLQLKHPAEPERLIEDVHIELEFLLVERDRTFPENAAALLIALAGHDDPAENMIDRGKGKLVSNSGEQSRAGTQQRIDRCDSADQNAEIHIIRIICLDVLHEHRTERNAHEGRVADAVMIADRKDLLCDRIQRDIQLREPEIALVVARQVDRQHIVVLRQQRDLIFPDPRIAAEAVQQNDCFRIPVLRGNKGVMQHE